MNDRELNDLAHARLADLRAARGPRPVRTAPDVAVLMRCIARTYAVLPERVTAFRPDR